MARTSTVSLCLVALISVIVAGPTTTGAAIREGYSLFPGIGYYRAEGTTYNWSQAYDWCTVTGGMLAVPNSDAEADVFKNIIASYDTGWQNIVYIGFHDLFVNGQYETIHDSPLATTGYYRWAAGTPTVSPTLRCGGFSKDGGLVNLDCASTASALWICELPLWSDYELVPDLGYYKFHVDAKNWNEAWRTCREEGSHLAVINNMVELAALQKIFAAHPNIPEAYLSDWAWVGVHARFAFGKFVTVLGTSLDKSGYSGWMPGYPEHGINVMNTDVALFRIDGSLGVLQTSYKLGFFCEHELQ